MEVLKSLNSSFLIFYKTSNIIIIISIATIITIFEPLLVVFPQKKKKAQMGGPATMHE